jgi:hypothetical protein
MVTGSAPTAEISFRLLLQSELARRCSCNPNYSLRAFGMQLDVDNSTLSQWLRWRRPIATRSIESIGARLGITPEAIKGYVGRARRGASRRPADDVYQIDCAVFPVTTIKRETTDSRN